MATTKVFITTHPVATYFALTFAISWGCVLLAVGGPGGIPGTGEEFERMFPLVFVAMLTGPTIAGLLLTGLVHGRKGFRDLRRRLFTWRVDGGWYAVALLTAPLVMMAVLVALSFASPAFIPGVFASPDKPSLLVTGIVVGLGAGFFEELGWTGFAIPELRRRYDVLATGLIVGVLWGAWHLLTNVFWAGATTSGLVSPAVFLAARSIGFLIGALPAFRVLMVWVYDQTGSLLVAMLMHVSLTASTLILGPVAISGLALLTYDFVLAAALWIVVGGIAVANGWQLSGTGPRANGGIAAGS